MKRNPVLIWMSILAGLQLFLGSAAGVSIVEESYLLAQVFALAMIAVGAAQAGIQFYVRGQVTPNSKVAERVEGDQVIAGEANDMVLTGHPVRMIGEQPPT